jgi:hypothetical protein
LLLALLGRDMKVAQSTLALLMFAFEVQWQQCAASWG